MDDEARVASVRDALTDPANDVLVSIVSLWEIAVKSRIGKLRVDLDAIVLGIESQRFEQLDIRIPHLEALSRLPDHHRDPFDHLLIAQAQVEGLTFVTSDRIAASYDIDVLRCR